jgi:hypothetical protein
MRLILMFLSFTMAAPLHAALVTTGTISGTVGEIVTVPLPMYTDPGSYRAYASFSGPGAFSLRYQVIRTTNFFCDFEDGGGFVACGGDDVPIGFDTFSSPGERSATLAYAIGAPFREDYSPTQYGLVFDHAEGADFEFIFEDDGSVSYRVVTAPVPEPASWALMLAGFGLAGAALRRRQTIGDTLRLS